MRPRLQPGAHWRSRPAAERFLAVWDATATAYAFKGIKYDPTRRSSPTGVALPMVAMAVLFTILLIPGLIVAGSIAALVYAIHSAFASSTGGAAEAGLLVQVFFGSVGFLLMLLAGICLGGPVSTGIREYALMFYGGRYRALGDILYPTAVPPPPETRASASA